MKRITLLVAAILGGLMLHAQTEAGSIVLMGGGGFFTSTSESKFGNNVFESKWNQTFLDFGGMYMLSDPFGVGLALTSNNWTSFSDGNKSSSQSLFGAMVMARYYSPCMAPRFYAFGQADFGFASGKDRDYDDDGNEIEDNRDNLSQLSFGIRPGIAYFFTPAVMIEASFGALAWSQTKAVNNADNDVSSTDTQLEFFAFSKSLQIGFCWWIGRKGRTFN